MNANTLVKLLQNAYQNLKQGQYPATREWAARVLARQPDHTDALMAMGLSWLYQKHALEAIPWLVKAIRSKPDNPAIWHALLSATKEAKTPDWAVKNIEAHLFNSALERHLPEELLVLLIEILEQAGEYEQVIAWLDKQVNTPESKKAWAMACRAWNLEMLNRIEQAKKEAQNCLAKEPDNFRANVVMARLALRQHDPDSSLAFLAAIPEQTSPINQAIVENLKAQALEQMHQYQAAFTAYTRSNQQLKALTDKNRAEAHTYSLPAAELMQTVDWQGLLATRRVNGKRSADNQSLPVFLVGFPRAGTTLLEKMLDAHPEITTLEEKPAVEPVLAHCLQSIASGQQLTDKLSRTDQIQREQLRQAYTEQRNQYLSSEESKQPVIIDKLPLNIIYLGLLGWLFPEARFVVATRDPRDVALSCYFQLFQPNPAMQNFLDWQQTAAFLRAAMDAGLDAVPFVGESVHFHRYEDFVANPVDAMKSLLAFLNRQWHNNMNDFQKNLVGKNINTPSYQRVTQAIDQSRVARWRHYDWAIAKVENDLHPLAEKLGYRW